MKHFIYIITVFLISIFCIDTHAEDNTNIDESPKTVELKSAHKSKKNRLPSSIMIFGTLSNHTLSLRLPDDTEYAEIRLGDFDAPIWNGYISPDFLHIELPILNELIEISCITDQNQIFTGTLYL